ncbi:MAG: hypothetical protein VX641_06710 [Planctomycetota bacterium]|nr:hypothetical protein [Planctomycetota bacterium]
MGLIDQLQTLYRVDSQVRGLRTRVDNSQRYLNAQVRQLGELTTLHDEAELKLRQSEASLGNLENERDTIQARVDKLRDELNACTTSKQYSAVQEEMKSLKEKVDELDTQALNAMEQIEQLRADADAIQEKRNERETLRKKAEEDLEERTQDVGDRLAELEQERDVAASMLPDRALDVFNHSADLNDGDTMAEIREVNRRHREYVCGACNVELPFNTVVLLTNNSESLVQCVGCQRIMYIAEELKTALSK